ncbi:U3 small nucleolar RNA-associated protein 4 homolog [Anopheles bellator]|uniref:U3 small nucleolar RNA-associated protein 4 homolog n=1 Tax=Anopheles bellator TaxID=139047 RepID=UPI002649973E|nr:U3 small nucleolar RNA-associated protein 4 homolog [Anopheles bellator]
MIPPKPITNQHCRLHNVQFYNLLPRGIVCSAINEQQHKLALARDDGTIEIWNMAHAPFLEKTVVGGAGLSIEGLAWAGERLFSVSLAGTLIEWDMRTGDGGHPRVKQSLLVTGNSAWCIAVSRDDRLLAVGTEGGYINLYRLENDELTYERILDKQDGRIVCCRFNHNGDFLVTGSADAVRVWDVRKGHAVHKMTTGRSDRGTPTIVWDVAVLKDFTVISVDSRGRMMFFDGHLGTVLDNVPVSKADLLCLALTEDEEKLFAAGVESNIVTFRRMGGERLKGEKRNNFVRNVNRRCHTHDIKTLATVGRTGLVSGGIDGTLVVSSYPPFQVDKYLPLLPAPTAVVAHGSRTVLLRYTNYLEVWTLARLTDDAADSSGGRKILQIRSKNDEHIVCAAISPDGQWIVYSTENTVRLLHYSPDPRGSDSSRARLMRVKSVPEQFRPGYRVDFTCDSGSLFLYHSNRTITLFACLDNGKGGVGLEHTQTLDGARWLSEAVHLSAVSQCNRYLVCADTASSIVVFEKSAAVPSPVVAKWKRSISLPRYKLPPTAIAIQPGKTRLVVAFADHKLFLYDFDEFQFVFSAYLKLGDDGVGIPNHPISGIVFDPRHESAMLLKNASDILSVSFGATENPELDEPHAQKRKSHYPTNGTDSSNGTADQLKHTLKKVRESNRLVSIEWLGEDELVAIEANALALIEHLPGAFRKKLYGKT